MIINFSQSQALSIKQCYGNEIVVGVTLLGYGREHVTCCLREWSQIDRRPGTYCSTRTTETRHDVRTRATELYKHRNFTNLEILEITCFSNNNLCI